MVWPKCRILSCLLLAMVGFGNIDFGRAESLQKLRGISHSQSKSDLFIQAMAHVHQRDPRTDPIIQRTIDSLVKKGEQILAPVGEPPLFPTGSIKKPVIRQEIMPGGRTSWHATADAQITIIDETSHRFLIELMNVATKDGQPGSSSFASFLGVNKTSRLNLGTGLFRPGRYEVLHILIARPLKGDSPPKILDVARSIGEVPVQ